MQPITRNGPPAIKPFGIRPGPQARGTPVGLRLQFAGKNKHGPETGTCCRQKTANKTAVPDMLHPADYPIIKNTEVRCREPDMVNDAGINTAVQYFRYAEGNTECAQNIFSC